MACAEHKERLIEAALDPESDAVHEMRFVRHVETCRACRAELDRQRALYEQIEDGVAALVGVQAPAAIAARVRQEIASEQAPLFVFWNWGWTSAAAVAAIAIAIAFAVRAPHRSPTSGNSTAANVTSPAAPTPTNGTHSVDIQAATTRAPHVGAHAAAQVVHAITRVQQPELISEAVAATIGPPRVQVMVPPGQREAVLRLAAALQTGRVDAASLIRPAQSLEPAELKIAPLEIEPLVPDENDAGSNPPDTKPSIRN